MLVLNECITIARNYDFLLCDLRLLHAQIIACSVSIKKQSKHKILFGGRLATAGVLDPSGEAFGRVETVDVEEV